MWVKRQGITKQKPAIGGVLFGESIYLRSGLGLRHRLRDKPDNAIITPMPSTIQAESGNPSPAPVGGIRAGVLVVLAERVDERYRGEAVVAEGAQEVLLVFQVGGPAGSAIGVVGVVSERLVVELKEWVGVAHNRVVPAARIPGPGDVLVV